jgi:predicted ATPase
VITLLQARNFRCLRHLDLPLAGFQVLVGANASGKSTLFDALCFLSDLVSTGSVADAVARRTSTFDDLVWGRKRADFDLAIETGVPDGTGALDGDCEVGFDRVRYELRVAHEPVSDLLVVAHERVWVLGRAGAPSIAGGEIFPGYLVGGRCVIQRRHQEVEYYAEAAAPGAEPLHRWKLGAGESALAALRAVDGMPVCHWLRELLARGVRRLALDAGTLRRAAPPGLGRDLLADGGNLPGAVEALRLSAPELHRAWIDHLRTALPDLAEIRVVERSDDRHRYLVLRHDSGLEVPSWTVSEGTLRLLALTLPAYQEAPPRVLLVEEPENGIHPSALETMAHSLRSMYDSQVIVATHSPVILGLVEPHEVLCFTRPVDGETTVVAGDRLPALRDWTADQNLGSLLVGGVLG